MKIVIGVDAGGSNTRALALSETGKVLGYAETAGGNPNHDSGFRANIRSAILQASQGCGVENVTRVVAGIAGFDAPADLEWVVTCTDVPGLKAERSHFNDTDVAHFGAFGGEPGIASIQGTGSMILAITESGRRVVNFDLGHYAYASAHVLAFRAVMGVFTKELRDEDGEFVRQILEFWGAESVHELRELGFRSWGLEPEERRRKFGRMGSLVTSFAEAGSPLAMAACDAASEWVAEGIGLLGPLFECEEVNVVLVGSVVQSKFVSRKVQTLLRARNEKQYRLAPPQFPPVVGAALMALRAERTWPTEQSLFEIKSSFPVPNLPIG